MKRLWLTLCLMSTCNCATLNSVSFTHVPRGPR